VTDSRIFSNYWRIYLRVLSFCHVPVQYDMPKSFALSRNKRRLNVPYVVDPDLAGWSTQVPIFMGTVRVPSLRTFYVVPFHILHML
jgi:hypothetical protein